MLKQFILLIVVSILVTLYMVYAQQGVHLLLDAHDWVSQLLTGVFTEGQAGNIARGLLSLMAIPFIAGLIAAIFYWFARRHWFPYFMAIVWAVWLVQVGALVVMYKVPVVG